MSIQSILAISSAGLASWYFIRGAILDFRPSGGGACGKCASGGCPVARKK